MQTPDLHARAQLDRPEQARGPRANRALARAMAGLMLAAGALTGEAAPALAAPPALSEPPPLSAQDGASGCPGRPGVMGTARTLALPAQGPGVAPSAQRGSPQPGRPEYGTLQYARTLPLAPGELVLTFDDGPDPVHTPAILDALDAHCVKATFFVVGRNAARHPDLVAEIWRRGHTIATHSWSHPNLARLGRARAQAQIARGIEAANAALAGLEAPDGTPARAAPFFRFPGLNHTRALRGWLAARGIATFSCDIGTDDWRPISARTLERRALAMIEARGRGIVIFHDTRARTAAALPAILDKLSKRGYRAVHLVSGTTSTPPGPPAEAAPPSPPSRARTAARSRPPAVVSWQERLASAQRADALTAQALAAARAATGAAAGPAEGPAR